MKIGFVGLGIMGKPMAKNLLKAGYELVVYDIVAAPLEEVVKAGAKAASSPKDVAAQGDVIVTMLPNSPHVKEAVLGKNGVIEGARKGSIVVDMSSIAPLVAQEVAAELAKKGVEMLDAPVSGGEPKAIDGTLAIMVGGKAEIFEKVKPILLKMGASAVLCGEIGSGNVTKLANQIIVALNIAAMSEALVLAAKAGVDPGKVFDAIKGGTCRQHGAQRQGAHGAQGQLQGGLPHRAAHQGPAERAGHGPRHRGPDPVDRHHHGDHASPAGRRQAEGRPRRGDSVLREAGWAAGPQQSLTGCRKTASQVVIRRCAAFVNAHMQSAGSWRIEAGSLADGAFFSFEPQASCLKLISALADSLTLVFQHPGNH